MSWVVPVRVVSRVAFQLTRSSLTLLVTLRRGSLGRGVSGLGSRSRPVSQGVGATSSRRKGEVEAPSESPLLVDWGRPLGRGRCRSSLCRTDRGSV